MKKYTQQNQASLLLGQIGVPGNQNPHEYLNTVYRVLFEVLNPESGMSATLSQNRKHIEVRTW